MQKSFFNEKKPKGTLFAAVAPLKLDRIHIFFLIFQIKFLPRIFIQVYRQTISRVDEYRQLPYKHVYSINLQLYDGVIFWEWVKYVENIQTRKSAVVTVFMALD